MSSRIEIIGKINELATGFLREEIDHQMTVERDYDYDELDALFDIEDRAEIFKERGLLTACRRLLIEVGFYRAMPQEEINNTSISSGTTWYFKLGGTAYTSDYSQFSFEKELNDMCESEPPMTLDAQRIVAWEQKKGLRA